jgi:large subunit ribosomal protein L29
MEEAKLEELELEDLVEKEKVFRKELFNLRFQKTLGQVKDIMRIRMVRRDIARVLTYAKMKGQK